MTTERTSPLADAIGAMSAAAKFHLDGTCAFAQEAATRMSEPVYRAETAAQDLNGYAVRAAQSWWVSAFAWVDAIAFLSEPEADAHLFTVTIPAVTTASTATVRSRTWTWGLGDEPPDVSVRVLPPVVLAPGTTTLRIRVTPVVPEPSWDVELAITPIGSGDPILRLVLLD